MNIRKTLFFYLYFVAIVTLLVNVPARVQAASDAITLSLPESIITQTTKALLPLRIDANSKILDGDITIINISNLQLTENHLACRLHLAGNNLAFLTEIAGHEIRLKVGSVELDFQTDAALRFDSQKQLLYLKPVVSDMTATGKGANDEIGKAIIALLNGREFPISLKKLEPLVAEAGPKTVTIDTKIEDIKATKDLLVLKLAPVISARVNK